MKQIIDIIAKTLGIGARQIEQTLGLLDGGATIPFIARYRKEATGGLDEVQIAEVAKQNEKFKELIHRKEYILQTRHPYSQLLYRFFRQLPYFQNWQNHQYHVR